MAEQTTTNYGFSYYDQYDINWHTGLNNNFINLDSLLYTLEQGILDIGSQNFIPHTLLTRDSDADGIPDCWKITSGGAYITGRQLQTGDVMGFARKLVLTLNNSSGTTQYGIIECQGVTPPNTDITFSAWLKSANLRVKLRIYDGANNDSGYATHAGTERVEFAHTVGMNVSSVNLGIVIEIPDGTTSETVEFQLPMLNVGDKASAFCPALHDVNIVKQTHEWYVSGNLATGNNQGGVWIVPQTLTVEKAYIYCKNPGTAGNTVVDVNKNGTTIFTTQTNRPALAYNDADKKAVSGAPEVTGLVEGDIITIDIDQTATGAADLTVILICR
jgi:hypothetical protein